MSIGNSDPEWPSVIVSNGGISRSVHNQSCRSPCLVDAPVSLSAFRQSTHVLRIDDIGGERRAAPSSIAVGADPIQPERERVARFSAIHVERAGLRVPAWGNLLAMGVTSCCIDGGRNDRVAVGNMEHGVVRADSGVIVCGGKMVRDQGTTSSCVNGSLVPFPQHNAAPRTERTATSSISTNHGATKSTCAVRVSKRLPWRRDAALFLWERHAASVTKHFQIVTCTVSHVARLSVRNSR